MTACSKVTLGSPGKQQLLLTGQGRWHSHKHLQQIRDMNNKRQRQQRHLQQSAAPYRRRRVLRRSAGLGQGRALSPWSRSPTPRAHPLCWAAARGYMCKTAMSHMYCMHSKGTGCLESMVDSPCLLALTHLGDADLALHPAFLGSCLHGIGHLNTGSHLSQAPPLFTSPCTNTGSLLSQATSPCTKPNPNQPKPAPSAWLSELTCRSRRSALSWV